MNLTMNLTGKRQNIILITIFLDSRFWGKVFESKPLNVGVLDVSQSLGSRTIPKNREIQNACKVCAVPETI